MISSSASGLTHGPHKDLPCGHGMQQVTARATATKYAAMALEMSQGLPMIAPSRHSLSQRQTHKGKGRASLEEHAQGEESSDEGEQVDLSRAALAAHAELCEKLLTDVSTTATASSEVVDSATPADNSSPSRSSATPAATAAVPAATGAADTTQTLLPPGTYQPPLPWVMHQWWKYQVAAAQQGEPSFNAQGERVNSRGKPYKQFPPAGRTGCNGGSHASWKKREKEKARRLQTEKRVATGV